MHGGAGGGHSGGGAGHHSSGGAGLGGGHGHGGFLSQLAHFLDPKHGHGAGAGAAGHQATNHPQNAINWSSAMQGEKIAGAITLDKRPAVLMFGLFALLTFWLFVINWVHHNDDPHHLASKDTWTQNMVGGKSQSPEPGAKESSQQPSAQNPPAVTSGCEVPTAFGSPLGNSQPATQASPAQQTFQPQQTFQTPQSFQPQQAFQTPQASQAPQAFQPTQAPQSLRALQAAPTPQGMPTATNRIYSAQYSTGRPTGASQGYPGIGFPSARSQGGASQGAPQFGRAPAMQQGFNQSGAPARSAYPGSFPSGTYQTPVGEGASQRCRVVVNR